MGASRYPQEYGGFLQVSGLTYRIDPAIPSSVVLDDKGRFVKVAGPRRVKDVQVNGKAIEADEDYRVGGTAYVLQNGGDGQTCRAASCWKIRACPTSRLWQTISAIKGTRWLRTMAIPLDKDGLPSARKKAPLQTMI